jgi:hypothetical protein
VLVILGNLTFETRSVRASADLAVAVTAVRTSDKRISAKAGRSAILRALSSVSRKVGWIGCNRRIRKDVG